MTGRNVAALTRQYRLVRRPVAIPGPNLPLAVRSVAHAVFAPDTWEDRQVRNFAKVMWSVSGKGFVQFSNRERLIEPGQIAVFLPGTLHQARSGKEDWEVRWFTVDGELTGKIFQTFGLAREGVYLAGPAPVDLFAALESALRNVTPSGELHAGAIAYELIGQAARIGTTAQDVPAYEQARRIIQRSFSDPEFTIQSLAGELDMHRSTLCRLFSEQAGLTPSQYLLRLKIQRAVELLKTTGTPIKEITRLCGFSDPAYFSRIFRQIYGHSPHDCRAE